MKKAKKQRVTVRKGGFGTRNPDNCHTSFQSWEHVTNSKMSNFTARLDQRLYMGERAATFTDWSYFAANSHLTRIENSNEGR
jgi:hypothetical protein